MAKYLVVSSDDFGMCHAVNAGIASAMTNGIVTSTNLLVPCPWFFEAVALARELGLPVGVHLCVTCDWDRMKWGPLTRAPSLCDENGHFWPSYAALARGAQEDEMYAELEAQIERVRSSGIEPTHLDSHMLVSGDNGEFTSRVKAIVRRLCKKYDLIYTYDSAPGVGLTHFRAEFCCSPVPLAETWQTLESWTADGVYHLIGHAAAPSPELFALCSPEHPARDWAATFRLKDHELFTNPATKERIAALGFQLVGIPALLALPRSA